MNSIQEFTCNWCYSRVDKQKISFCLCGESSYVCHVCILKAHRSKNKYSSVCCICKKKKLINLPRYSHYNRLSVFFNRGVIRQVSSNSQIDILNIENDHMDSLEQLSERDSHLDIPGLTLDIANNEDNSYFCYHLLKRKAYRCFIWMLIVLSISWLFAPFSYFIVFRMRNSNNYFKKFYITITTGMVFGVPITLYFRKKIERHCLPES